MPRSELPVASGSPPSTHLRLYFDNAGLYPAFKQHMSVQSTLILLLIIVAKASASDSVNTTAVEEGCIDTIRKGLPYLRRFSSSQLRQAFIHVAAAQKHGRPLLYRSILDKSVHHGLAALARCGKKAPEVPCLQDPSMPAAPAGQRVFFASNLRDNAPLMPHYITQMLFTVTALPVGSAFVSIYESGSTDATGTII